MADNAKEEHAQALNKQEFVDFNLVAAGQYVVPLPHHTDGGCNPGLIFGSSDGLQSDLAGSIIIKPCTATEKAFYESASSHPAFQALMPTFIGTLSLNEDQSSDISPPDNLKAMRALAGGSTLDHAAASTTKAAKRTSWKPSGGKKIDTGLAIVMENIAHGFRCPNILDLKLGSRLWADDAPIAKRQKLEMDSKSTTSSSLGFRISGMNLWNGNTDHGMNSNVPIKGAYKHFDKSYGCAFTMDDVKNGFIEYLGGADENGKLKFIRRKLVAQRLLRKVESIQSMLENEETRMYSASILMMYEGDPEALEVALRDEEIKENADAENIARGDAGELDEDDEEQEEQEEGEEGEEDEDEDEDDEPESKVYDVRLIDFAHSEWTPGQGPDENAIQGVRSIAEILRELVN